MQGTEDSGNFSTTLNRVRVLLYPLILQTLTYGINVLVT